MTTYTHSNLIWKKQNGGPLNHNMLDPVISNMISLSEPLITDKYPGSLVCFYEWKTSTSWTTRLNRNRIERQTYSLGFWVNSKLSNSRRPCLFCYNITALPIRRLSRTLWLPKTTVSIIYQSRRMLTEVRLYCVWQASTQLDYHGYFSPRVGQKVPINQKKKFHIWNTIFNDYLAI